jgi:large subunit ribosomal protein L21
MRFAIVESGGKQYRAIEGQTIEVDRLPVEAGKKFDIERILLMADGEDVLVGTPTVSDILVKVTVVDHTKGPKIDRFKYRPKKRIRVRGGHRQQYTRLLVDFIGRADEKRERTLAPHASAGEAEKAEPTPAPVVVEEEAPKVEKKARATKSAKAETEAPKSTKKTTATKSSTKKTEKK